MENKTEWYRTLLRKLNNIKDGRLDLDEYINEVKSKLEAENKALSMSGVSGSACLCFFETDRMNCTKECPKKPKIVQS